MSPPDSGTMKPPQLTVITPRHCRSQVIGGDGNVVTARTSPPCGLLPLFASKAWK